MEIRYLPNERVVLVFTKTEIAFALDVLKAIQKSAPQDFIARAITDIGKDLKPKIPQHNYFHLCTKCYREVDERDPKVLCYTKDGDTKWFHMDCPPLKPDSQRER